MRHFTKVSLGALLIAAISLTGCAAVNKTGEVGNKNLRPYQSNDYEKHGLPLNGVHSYGSPTYRLKSAGDIYNHQDEWMLRNRMGNNLIGAHGNDELAFDRDLASRLEALPNVKKAYVLLAGRRAYVGIEENRHAGMKAEAIDVRPEMKNQLIGRVKSASAEIQQVYVTTNREYLDRMKIYSKAAQSGHSAKEFLAEFNALAARIFPAVTYRDDSGSAAPIYP